jgi:hypothetical protein
MKPLKASLTVCQRLRPGLGLNMGMERRSSGPTPPPPTNPDFIQFLITGQSLSLGATGVPVLSTTQPYANRMFLGGVRSEDSELDSVLPLIESVDGTDGETVASGSANELSDKTSRNFLMSCNGLSAAPYSILKKGTAPYALGIAAVTAAPDALASDGKTYDKVGGILILHGESDQELSVPDYDLHLAEWQADYDADIKAITAQEDDVPIFVYQQCNGAPSQASSLAVATALKTLDAYRADSAKVRLVTPNYMFLRSDGVHLSAHGYRSLGCMYSKVVKQTVLDGLSWQPVAPILITRSGAVITATFSVPTPPLVFDLRSILNPGNYGFSYKDDNDDTTILSVAITAEDTVTITLDQTPTGANQKLRYGFAPTSSATGPYGGPRGNLRDSSDTDNSYGYEVPRHNWGCLFDDPIPFGLE